MKFFIVLACIVAVAYSEEKKKSGFQQAAERSLKICCDETGCGMADIAGFAINDLSIDTEWAAVPDTCKCFPKCLLSKCMMADAQGCFKWESAARMIPMILKGDFEEAGKSISAALSECGPTVSKDDCCRQTWLIMQCMIPKCAAEAAILFGDLLADMI